MMLVGLAFVVVIGRLAGKKEAARA